MITNILHNFKDDKVYLSTYITVINAYSTAFIKHLFLVLSLSFGIFTNQADGNCAMYDVCNSNGITDQNCKYDGPGKPLNNTEAAEILRRRCVDFFTDGTYFFLRLDYCNNLPN